MFAGWLDDVAGDDELAFSKTRFRRPRTLRWRTDLGNHFPALRDKDSLAGIANTVENLQAFGFEFGGRNDHFSIIVP